MKFIEKVTKTVAKAVASIWKFCTRTFTICLIASIVVFCITLLMPQNMLNVIEIIRGLIG